MEPNAPGNTTAATQTILVVDDSRTVQKLVETVFRNSRFRVVCASEGNAGLALASEVRPDIILVDFQMPGMYGHVFCKKIRENPLLQATPLVLISAKSDSVAYYFEQVVGVVHRLQKPFDSKELIRVVERIVPPPPNAARTAEPAAANPASPAPSAPPAVPQPAPSPQASVAPSPTVSAPPPATKVAAAAVVAAPAAGATAASAAADAEATPDSPAVPAANSAATPDLLTAIGERVDRALQNFARTTLPHLMRDVVINTLAESGLTENENLVLSSSLELLNLPDALNFANHARITGRMTLLSRDLLGEILIDRGMFVTASVKKRGNHEFLTDLLIEGATSPAQRQRILRAVASARQQETRIGEALVQAGVIAEADLMAALEQQARRAFTEMLGVTEGNFFLQTCEMPPDVRDLTFRLPLMQVLMDGLRQLDERARAMQGFANDSVVLCKVIKNDEELQLTERELEVFTHVDGHRTLRELVKKSPFQEAETLQICQRLSRVGVLRPKTATPAPVG